MAKSEIVREIAGIERDPMVAAYTSVLAPTDETLKTRGGGKGIALYDEVRRDPHTFSVLQKRALEVVSREWTVEPASESRIDRKAADLVRSQLKNLGFDRLTRGLLGAVLKGFSVAEVMWANADGVWTVIAVKVRKQRRFRFTVESELRLITHDNQVDGEALPDRKFIVHRHSIDDDDDDPYGVGLGSVLYWASWFKRHALAHWLRSVERFAAPTADAAYDGAFDEEKQKQALSALRTMANDAGLVHPKSLEVKLLEAAKGGGGDYGEKLNRYLDEMISEAVLGETLSTNSGERGARSLGEVHNEVRIAIAKADADLISATIKDTLVRWIVELNYPGAALPDVWRDFSEPEDLDQRASRDKTLHDMGYEPKEPETYLSDTYGGEWQRKTASQPGLSPAQKLFEQAGADDTKLGEFADPATDASLADTMTDQMETLGAPAIGVMLEAIRREVDLAVSYDDLSDRLLKLSAEIGVEDLAQLMEQAETVAQLAGRADVQDEGDA